MTTKKDYWHYLDSGAAKPNRGTLKDVQDAFILYVLRGIEKKRILELGGGNSRVLPLLAERNECWNVDKFEGLGGGPVKARKGRGIRIIREYMGSFSDEIPSRYFDYVISISAVEHIRHECFSASMRDCTRVLKPGGLMLHAIDVYLFDDINQHPHGTRQRSRLRLYRSVPEIVEGACEWIETPVVDENVTARASFAVNSVDELYKWNASARALIDVREIAVSCNLEVGLQKAP
ncbi:MAG: class I SAM-dependent methyltransferase [Gammaproteobacteria bacterium]